MPASIAKQCFKSPLRGGSKQHPVVACCKDWVCVDLHALGSALVLKHKHAAHTPELVRAELAHSPKDGLMDASLAD